MIKSKKDGVIKKLAKFLFYSSEQGNLRESIQDAIEESSNDAGSNLTSKEKTILENILTINKLKAYDIMVPRADIICASHNASFDDLIKIINAESHSRIPIYRKDLDDVLGMIHIKDLIKLTSKEMQNNFDLKSLLKEVLFIPPSMPVLNILLKMQSTKLHMALVIDEHGGTDGLVTIEDLVEEIVGEIQDEHDNEEIIEFKKINDTTFIADAKMELSEFQKKTGIIFNSVTIDTLGGYVFSMINRVPQKGEIIKSDPAYTFEVLDADPRKIKILKISKS
ncbi:MAG: hemolysin family protein [Proteobacteria bacterium]|nr:hemolysin family protein [Pseudomonadota bacterium]